MPILSIIVPVYNVSPYLREGLDSILNQEVQDIEIICINDGSTDNSLSILKEYQSKYKNIIIISQKNQGVSAARNTGLSIATGTYTTFFDPDDWVKPTIYSKLIHYAQLHCLDIAICAFQTNLSNEIIKHPFNANQVLSPLDLIKDRKQLHTNNAFCFSWRMIFKRDFLIKNKLYYNTEISIGEDTLFNMAAIFRASKIFYLDESLYIHRINNIDSAMNQKYKPKLESSLQTQIAEKKKIIENYHVDQYTPITQDMSEDIVKRYTLMLFNNLRNNHNESYKLQGIKRILNMPMITDAMKVIGFRNIYPSWKEYIFYLAMKFKCARLVHKLYFR